MPTDQILATEEMVGAGHGTKADTLNRLLNKLTTAGDILYATAAQTAARLAIGAANTKLFTDAGATAPEWAAGVSIQTNTRAHDAASGDVAYTGVGFKPKALIIIATISGIADTFFVSVNADTTSYGVGALLRTAPIWSSSNKAVYIEYDANDGSENQSAIVKSMDADGYTLTWTRTGTTPSATIVFHVIAIR